MRGRTLDMHSCIMDLFRSAINLEHDTKHNKFVGTSIYNVEGFNFWSVKTKVIVPGSNISLSRGFYGTIEMQDGQGKKL